MKTILLIHGPNLNLLGKRDHGQYGTMSLIDIENSVQSRAKDYRILCFQSNHEGDLIDFIQAHTEESMAMIINPGAFTHYSYALHDAILDSQLPTVEVHLSNIMAREPWRAHSVITPVCVHTIMGKKLNGYIEAIDYILEHEYAY
jgi:3-dehydroquinate dehydratase-2